MEDYSKNKSSKLEETNSSLRFKLKLPDYEKDLVNSNQVNDKIIKLAPIEVVVHEDEELEEGEIKKSSYPSQPPPPPPTPASKKEDIGDDIDEVKLRICPFCQKGFSSGKALGGHMRIHTDNYRSKKRIVVASAISRWGPHSSSSPNPKNEADPQHQDFKCTLCPKVFPSLKSLFGHMRSHPDRDWRGMNPPQQHTAAYEADGDDPAESSLAAEDRLRRLGTWRVTGKRGRMASHSSTSSSSASFGPQEEAAAEIMLLLRGNGHSKDDDNNDGVENVTKKPKNDKGKGLTLFDDDETYYLKNLGFLPNHDVNHDNQPIEVAKPSNNHNNNEFSITCLNKWICTTCGKAFPTHQALGGHRSSHNKDKYNPPIPAIQTMGPSNGNNENNNVN